MAEINKRRLRYSVLKEFDKGIKPTHETFDINQKDYINFLKEMQNDGYITGIIFTKTHIIFEKARLTPFGEQYIDENSISAKTYRAAKEIRDWIRS